MSEPLRAFELLPLESQEDEVRSPRLLVIVDDTEAGRAIRGALEADAAEADVEWVGSTTACPPYAKTAPRRWRSPFTSA